jgi:parallel beta-helix repeat protein
MTQWRSVVMIIGLATVGLAVDLAIPGHVSAQGVDCGATLGPGGTYTLDRDLTCSEVLPTDPDNSHPSDRVGIIKLFGGATLDLNGHTVACSSRSVQEGGGPSTTPMFGIVVRNSTLLNGTVRGCGLGVVTSASLIRKVVFDGNTIGISLYYKWSDSGNFIIGNTFRNGDYGVQGQESWDNVLIDNTAENNRRFGFDGDTVVGTFVGNTAVGNDVGFNIIGTDAFIGNRAIRNRVGFKIVAREAIGNIADNNAEGGFVSLNTQDMTRYNVAHENGQDGFLLGSKGATFKKNYALANRGVGIHVVSEYASPSVPGKKLNRNISMDNLGGDVADDENCQWTRWVHNTFETAAQSCID